MSDPEIGTSHPTLTIEQLLAVEACRDAARRYSYGVDRLDADTMRSAYWPDATDEHGHFDGNAHEFVGHCMTGHERWAWTMHTVSNHRVDLDDDAHARGEMYAIAYLYRKDESVLDTFYGRYLDTYERRGNEWRISHRVCVHHGSSSEAVAEPMALRADLFRQADFDRPANGRPIGP